MDRERDKARNYVVVGRNATWKGDWEWQWRERKWKEDEKLSLGEEMVILLWHTEQDGKERRGIFDPWKYGHRGQLRWDNYDVDEHGDKHDDEYDDEHGDSGGKWSRATTIVFMIKTTTFTCQWKYGRRISASKMNIAVTLNFLFWALTLDFGSTSGSGLLTCFLYNFPLHSWGATLPMLLDVVRNKLILATSINCLSVCGLSVVTSLHHALCSVGPIF